MSNTSELLFEYLREVLYDPAKATLDVERLDEDYVMLGKGLVYFAQCFAQYNELAMALAKGDLSVPLPPPENELAAPLKSLHASLRHLTWQSQQVAKGDYKQRVDFMGEFADAFNQMIGQLAERQQHLENEIEVNKSKSHALEQGNQFLRNITQYIPQQLFVIDRDKHEILLTNERAKREVERDPEYFGRLMIISALHKGQKDGYHDELQYGAGDDERYLTISAYVIEWNHINAEALLVNDVSDEKKQRQELETLAYRDAMTQLYNRFYGMLTLNKWLEEKKRFSLVFIDLDNLKYINDKHGHAEGNAYINNVANHLRAFLPESVVCRIGGDEFMLLVPGAGYDEAQASMNETQNAVQSDEYLEGKDYYYSISFGVVVIEEDNRLTSSDVLSIADERMYEHKRARKKQRDSAK